MSGGNIAVVQKHLLKVTLMIDLFQVVKLMNKKQTALRRELYHELTERSGSATGEPHELGLSTPDPPNTNPSNNDTLAPEDSHAERDSPAPEEE